MTDRLVSAAIAERLGTDTLARLRGLRRRLWWRRAVRSGLLILAAAILAVAAVQLLARAFPLEPAPLLQAGIGVLALLAWPADGGRLASTPVEAARRAAQ